MPPFQSRTLFVGVGLLMSVVLGLSSKESSAGVEEILKEIGTWADVGCTHEETTPACKRLKETARALHDAAWSTDCPKSGMESKTRDEEIKAFLQEKKDLVTSDYFKKYTPKEVAELLGCVKTLEGMVKLDVCRPDQMEFKCSLNPDLGYGKSPSINLVPSSDCKNMFFMTGEVLGKGGLSVYEKGLFYQKDGNPKWQEVARGTLLDDANKDYYAKASAFMQSLAAQQRPGVLQLVDSTPKHLYFELYQSDLEKALTRAPSNFGRFQMLVQGAIGLESLHQNSKKPGYVHQDVKPGNFLVNHPDQPLRAKTVVSDFDMVATVGKKNTENGGTPSYMAPERSFKEETPDTTEQDKKGDVYSFAQTVAHAFGIETAPGRELLTLNYFDRLRGHDEAHHLGQYSKFLTGIGELNKPPGIGALIKSGLAYNPDERPSMTEFRRRLEAMNRAAFLEEFGSLKLSRQKRAVEREKKYEQKTVFNGRLFEDRKGAENAAKVSGFAFAPVEDPKTRALRFGVVLQDGSGPFAMKSDPRNGREFGEELAEILRTNRFLPNHGEGMTLLQQAKKAKHRELQMLLQDLGLKE